MPYPKRCCALTYGSFLWASHILVVQIRMSHACRLLTAAADDPDLWVDEAHDSPGPRAADALAADIADLEAAFGGGTGTFRRFLETQLAAPPVAELFAGGTATFILQNTLRCGSMMLPPL